MPEVEVNRLAGNKFFAELLQRLHLELTFLVSVEAPNGSKVSRYFRPYVKYRSLKFNGAPCAQLYTANDSPHPAHSVSFSQIYPSHTKSLLVSPIIDDVS